MSEKEWNSMHRMLDVAGLVPVIGAPADVLNGVLLLGRGRYMEGGVSLLAAVPALGFFAGGTKLMKGTLKTAFRSTSGTKQIIRRSMNGKWRAFGNTGTLLRKGYSSSSRLQYSTSRLFWNDRTFNSISQQYWRQSGGAHGKHLHHWLFQNQTKWVPRGIRGSGINHLEIPKALNTWMGGRLGRELAGRGIVLGILGGTGYTSYRGTEAASEWLVE